MSYQDAVRAYVTKNNFPNEGKIPPERELVSILGLTRNQIRSAFKKLEQEGVIWRHVGKGTFVGRRPAEGSGAEIAATDADLANPREVIEARLVIEPILARMAALRATPRDIEAMAQLLEQLRKTPDPEEFKRLDRSWHLQLAQASGNRLLASFLDTINAQTDPNIWNRLRNLYMTSDRMTAARREHGVVLDAIRGRDPNAAEEAMRTHIRAVRVLIFGDFD
jgi:DNA-binding FadR family transcriptional regulator